MLKDSFNRQLTTIVVQDSELHNSTVQHDEQQGSTKHRTAEDWSPL